MSAFERAYWDDCHGCGKEVTPEPCAECGAEAMCKECSKQSGASDGKPICRRCSRNFCDASEDEQ